MSDADASPSYNTHAALGYLSESSRAFMEMLAFIYLQHHRAADAAVLLALLAQSTGDIRLKTRLKGAAALAQLRAGHPEKALRTIESLPLRHQLSPEFQLLRAQSLFALDRHPEAAAAMQAFVAARQAARRNRRGTSGSPETVETPETLKTPAALSTSTSVGRAS